MVKRVAPGEDDGVLTLPAEAAPIDDDVVREGEMDDVLPRRAVRHADGSITLPLLTPVTLKIQRGGETVREEVFEEVKMHRMTGADLMAIGSASSETKLAVSFARSARLNPAVATRLFSRLDGADAADASGIVAFFFGAGGRTGR